MAKKLFEIIVTEGMHKAQAHATRTDLQNTFEKKRHLFEKKIVTFTPAEEGAATVVETQSDIQTNVASELRWIAGIWSKALDASYQVAEGNTAARADVVLDNGTVLLENMPATALLELDKRAGDIFDLLKTVPTLDPAKGFHPDPDQGQNIFVAREVRKTRTKKVQQPLVKYAATEQHPAQVDVISIDIPAGQVKEQEWSGMITPARKGELLERAEEVRRAIKAALHRANATEMVQLPTCGQKMFGYILGN